MKRSKKIIMTKKSLAFAFAVVLAAFGNVRADGLYEGTFNLSANPTRETVHAGGTATFTLTVSPVIPPGVPPLPLGEVELAGSGPRELNVSVSPAAVELGATPVTARGTVVVAYNTMIRGTFLVVFTARGARCFHTVTVYVTVN
jgi:hypothetical protein